MQENKSNRTHTSKRAGGGNHFIIEPLLSYGRESTISSKELMTVLNMSERELRAQVAYERNRGAIICSSNQGYFKFKNREELKVFYKTLQNKANSIYQALRSAKRALDEDEIEGQQSFNQEAGYEE